MENQSFPGELMLGLLETYIWFDQKLQKDLAARKLPTVNRTESMIMLLAASGTVRPSVLAKRIGIARQSINTAVRNLEESGLIVLIDDPDDKRCKVIQRTRSAEKIYAAAISSLTGAENDLSVVLGPARMEALVMTLRDCRVHAEMSHA